MDQYNLLTRLKHGFRSRFSFETQLFATIQDLFSLRAKGAHVDIAVLDFSKAFEEVPHKLLMPNCQYSECMVSKAEYIHE